MINLENMKNFLQGKPKNFLPQEIGGKNFLNPGKKCSCRSHQLCLDCGWHEKCISGTCRWVGFLQGKGGKNGLISKRCTSPVDCGFTGSCIAGFCRYRGKNSFLQGKGGKNGFQQGKGWENGAGVKFNHFKLRIKKIEMFS